MNDQCANCRIRKFCYFEEPKDDWTCGSYEPDEEDDEYGGESEGETLINRGL